MGKYNNNYIRYLAGVISESAYYEAEESGHFDDYMRAMGEHGERMKEYEAKKKEHDAASYALDKEYAEKLWAAVNRAWDAGQSVNFNTMTRRFEVTPKNRAVLRLFGREIQMARGKSWDSLRGQAMNTMAMNLGVPPVEKGHLQVPNKPNEPDEPHAHHLTPDQYVRMKGGEELWRGVHKQAVENELDSGLVAPEHMGKVVSLYPDLIKK